jgi:putative membrane protein
MAGFTTALISCSWILNVFIKPILVILTITVYNFRLFLLVINALIILLCDNIVEGLV